MITPSRAVVAEFARYLRIETVGGVILLGAAAAALILANSPLSDFYDAVRDFTVGPAALHLNLTLETWATDGLLAVFFFVAGLELKRELVIGELSRLRDAALPVAAAIGGIVVPAVIALAVGRGAPGMEQAWAIPVATDIAFALGVLALAGRSLPPTARIFLLGLAVVDDLGAIILIAVVFTGGVQWLALVAAAALLAMYAFLQHRRVRSPLFYVPIVLATWFAVHEAGVHATIAGVALALLTRVRPDPGEEEGPAVRLEHRLQPFSAGFCVPVFAFFAAGVPVGAGALAAMIAEPISQAVIAGLLVGKLVGIFGASYLVVTLTPACRPRGLRWRDIFAVSMLGGVGFTISLLMTELSLGDAPPGVLDTTKAAVLVASATAALLASVVLVRRSRAHDRRRSAAAKHDPGPDADAEPEAGPEAEPDAYGGEHEGA